MSVRRPNVYQCPHLDTCIFPVDETHFKGKEATANSPEIIAHCREVSLTPKHPQYMQCQGYKQMNELPRNWFKQIYKAGQDIGMRSSRQRV